MNGELATRLREFPEHTLVNIGKHRVHFNRLATDAADALDAANKRIAGLEAALSRLERYAALNAFDRLIEDGHEKSLEFSRLLDDTRALLPLAAAPAKEEDNG